jgi:hypothetical protein
MLSRRGREGAWTRPKGSHAAGRLIVMPQEQFDLSDLAETPAPRTALRRRGRSVHPPAAAPSFELSELVAAPPRARRTSAASPPPVDSRLDSYVNDLIVEAARRSGFTYKLGEGSRTPEQQAGKVAAGFSRTYNSKHLSGRGRA